MQINRRKERRGKRTLILSTKYIYNIIKSVVTAFKIDYKVVKWRLLEKYLPGKIQKNLKDPRMLKKI